MPRVEIAVEGMTCGHCETSVTAALQAAGATNAVADFRRSYASADFGGNPAVLVDAVREAGYTPGTIDSDAVEEAPSITSDVPASTTWPSSAPGCRFRRRHPGHQPGRPCRDHRAGHRRRHLRERGLRSL